jgi:hypothetical protein
MTSTIDETKNLRTDARGRVRVPAERRNELLNEFERSGISAMRFAKMAGINYATFANWRQKRRQARAQAQEVANGETARGERPEANRPVRLFEAFATGRSAADCGGLRIDLSGGAVLIVESPLQLRLAAELLGILGQTTRRAC